MAVVIVELQKVVEHLSCLVVTEHSQGTRSYNGCVARTQSDQPRSWIREARATYFSQRSAIAKTTKHTWSDATGLIHILLFYL